MSMKSNDEAPVRDTTSESTPRREPGASGEGKRPYTSPRLVSYGRLRDVTLGGSPGMFDSGSVSTRKPG
jgi:hypothetical protein